MSAANNLAEGPDVDLARALTRAPSLRWLAAAAAVLSLAMACRGSTSVRSPTVEEGVTDAPPATPLGHPGRTPDRATDPPPMVRLRLVNRSDSAVCYVIVDASFHASAGSDIWYSVDTAGSPIASGSAYDFYATPVDTYNLHAQDCDYRTIDLRQEVRLEADYDWVIEESRAGESVDVVLVNGSPLEICTVYLSRTGIGYSTDEVSTSLPPGSSQTFELPVGPYDLWVADCGHDEFGTTFGVEVMECATWTVKEAGGELAAGCE